MKANDIKKGNNYFIKVGKNKVEVKIVAELEEGGWNVKVVNSGKERIIRDAKSFIGAAGNAKPAPKAKAAGGKKGAAKAKKAGADKTAKPKKDDPSRAGGQMSQTDAAAEVLKDSDGMRCPEMIAAMEERGLWKSPGGKTPANTLYAVIMREINTKANDSRFKKVDKGIFALR